VAAHEQAPGLRASRLAQLDAVVRAAGERAAAGHPPRLRVFDELRGRLRQAHDTCDQVGDRVWADYVTRLDRGLDELAVEVGRTAEPPAAGSPVEGMPYVHATRLEIDGWVLRLDQARAGTSSGEGVARDLAARTTVRLAEYRRGEATRDEVDRSVQDVRGAVSAAT
jgi:hypothetical protein